MALYLYNTLTRKKELFRPIHDKKVGFYSCGPTVYWFQHIGNLRSYIFNDILKRVLIYDGYQVKHVMNVTDVGHLTSDADTGEDKIEKAAAKEHKKAADIAEFYLTVFKEDLKKLNVLAPDIWCKATDHIPDQIDTVRLLAEKGFTYKTSDGVYFDTSKLDDYGKLDPGHKKELEAGKRVDMGEKRNKADFALWKFSEEPGKRQQEWDSPWGVGFPGWHIECSVMSSKYLGTQFDIHTGGEDHIQIHHTNEIAQSEAAYGKKPWVKYWLHGAFLTFKGEKVSKSKGGLFTISELQEKGYISLDYRYFCLNTQYRKQLSFSLEALTQAQQTYGRLKKIILELKTKKDSNRSKDFERYQKEFQESIDDDLNMPRALSVLWGVLRDSGLGTKEKLELVFSFDKVFGLGLKDIEEEKQDIPQKIQELAQEREKARKNKDWGKGGKKKKKRKKKKEEKNV